MIDYQSSQSLNKIQLTLSKSPNKSITQIFTLDQQVSCLQTFESVLYVGTNQSKVIVYQISKSQSTEQPLIFTKVAQLYPHCTFVKFIVVVSKFLVVVPKEEQQLIRVWDRQSLLIMHGFKGHQKQITAVIFLKDGKHIASVSQDATARIWDVQEHNQFDKQKFVFENLYPLLAIEEVNNNILALGGDDCCITLWDWKKLKTQCVVFGHPGSVYSLSFYFPYLVSSGGDSQIKIWGIRQYSAAFLSKTMADTVYQERRQLNLIKQIPGQAGQNQFFFKLQDYRMLVLDSAGKLIKVNQRIEVTSQLLPLQYYKKIISAKCCQQYLLFVCNQTWKNKKRNICVVRMCQPKVEEVAGLYNLSDDPQLVAASRIVKEGKSKDDESSRRMMIEEKAPK